MSAHGYALRRLGAMLARRPGAFLLNVLLTAIAIALPLYVTALMLALQPASDQLQVTPEVTVFAPIGMPPAALAALQRQLEAIPSVASVRLIGRADALRALAQRSGLKGLEDLKLNPLPDALVLRFPAGTSPDAMEAAAAAARALPGADAVQADADWYRRLTAVARAAGVVLGVLGGTVALLIALVLGGAVRGQATAHADELRVLRLVGARTGFIVRPYVLLGAVTLLLGSILAVGAVAAGVAQVQPALSALGALYGQNLTVALPPARWLAVLVTAATLTGAALGWLASRWALRGID